MTQAEQRLYPEADEASMSPTELLEKRLNRVNLALSELQGLNFNTFTNMQKDVVFSLHVVAALRDFLPKKQLDAAVAAATDKVVGAYDRVTPQGEHTESTFAVAPVAGNRPTPKVSTPLHETHMPAELRQAPQRHDIHAAAEAAQHAVEAFGEKVKQRIEGGVGEGFAQAGLNPRSLTPAGHKPTPVSHAAAGAAAPAPTTDDYLAHFIGSGSVFAKYFSPEVYRLGRGFVKPGYGGFGEWTEDALRVAPAHLREFDWPSGFYTDSETKLQQFFMSNAKLQVLVTNLPNDNIDVSVSFAPFDQRVSVRTLSVEQMKLVYGIINAIFNAGEKFASGG